jgi:acetyl esterase/lipase
MHKLRNLSYGDHPRQKLDIYPAKAMSHQLNPVLIFFYGGRWKQGKRSWYGPLARLLARQGMTVIVPDYRLYPEVRFPVFVLDAALAVAWVRRHIQDYGGDPQRIFLMGHSAGAHIASLLALDGRYLQTHDVEAQSLGGMIGLAGPYDFLPFQDDELKDIFAPEAQYPDTQPINFANGKSPPLLLLHGSKDKIVGAGNSKRLWQRVLEKGGRARMVFFRRLDHMTILLALLPGFARLSPVRTEVLQFMMKADGEAGVGLFAEPVSYE